MMHALACLGKSKGKQRLSSKVLKQLQIKLKKISTVYPTTKGWCIVDREGQALTESSSALGKAGEELTDTILGLRNAAHNYGKLQLHEVPDDVSIVHIEGDAHVFSFYVGAEHVLAFFSERESDEQMNFSTKDGEMKAIIEDLFNTLLQAKTA